MIQLSGNYWCTYSIESQNSWRWKGYLEIIYSCSKQGHLQLMAQNHVVRIKPSPQSQRIHSLSRQPVPVFDHSHSKRFFLCLKVIYLISFCVLCLLSWHWTIFFTSRNQAFIYFNKFSPEPSAFFFSLDDPSCLSLFWYDGFSKLLIIFVTLHLTHCCMSVSCFYLGFSGFCMQLCRQRITSAEGRTWHFLFLNSISAQFYSLLRFL